MKNLKTSAIVLLSSLFGFSSNAQNFQISGGTFYSMTLCSEGTVWTWGDNSNYQLGRDADLQSDPNPAPISTETLPKIKAVEAGSGSHALALACDGTVWAWGANGHGQLGTGLLKDSDGNNCADGIAGSPGNCDTYTPSQVVGGETGTDFLENIVYISGSTSSSYAITSEGKVLAWGSNQKGQLGIGGGENIIAAPVYVQNPEGTAPLENVIAIDATDFGCYAIVDDNGDGIGTVYGWGDNSNKQLGRGESTYLLPVVIKTSEGEDLDNITMVAAGDTHGLFLDADGYLWALGGVWGGGNQLGTFDGKFDLNAGMASKVLAGEQKTTQGYEDEPYLTNVKQIAAGQAHSLALVEHNNERYVMAWGTNSISPWKGDIASGMLGNGTTVSTNTPLYVLNEDGSDLLKNVQSISDGDQTSYATTIDPSTSQSATYIWGGNYFGQVGDGTTTNALYPTLFNEPGCTKGNSSSKPANEEGTGTISGIINATSNINIDVLLLRNGEIFERTPLGTNNEFSFDKLPIGEYEIVIEDGDLKTSQTVNITEEDETLNNISINLKNALSTESDKNITIAPQPASNYITVVGQQKLSANITDMAGRILLTHEGKNAIDISSLSGGTYIIQIKTLNKTISKTFTKR